VKESGVSSTDYLVIGAGATGLAFADSLIAEDPEAELVLVERRPGAGGHWLDTYPFVRLHTPSAFYGVNSLSLGEDRIDAEGENAGFYERATGQEIVDYFAQVAANLEATGRVRLLTEHEHLGPGERGERVRDLNTGEAFEIEARRKVVDARYIETPVPATHTPSFEVAPDARSVPVGELPDAASEGLRYCVLGTGKTAADACTWLLGNGVPAERIRWVRPREHWFHYRRHFQPLDLVGDNMEGIALDAEASANATDLEDLFARLSESGRLFLLERVPDATMYRGTMLSPAEVDALRTVEDVVRLGRVQRIERDRLVLDEGELDSGPDVLHVDCTARGLMDVPPVPVFQSGRIVLQEVRHNSPCFNAAMIAFLEAHRDDDAERNRLSPPNPYANSTWDWPGQNRRTWIVEQLWLGEPDIAAWIVASRLNLLRGLSERAGEPQVQSAVQRFVTNVGPAIERLTEIEAQPR
jgi:hypothetical protein